MNIVYTVLNAILVNSLATELSCVCL